MTAAKQAASEAWVEAADAWARADAWAVLARAAEARALAAEEAAADARARAALAAQPKPATKRCK